MVGQDAKKLTYQINRKFLPVPMGAQDITALVGAWQSGAISDRDLFNKFQEGEVIDSTKSYDEHQSEIDMQGPVAPAPVPANDGQQAA